MSVVPEKESYAISRVGGLGGTDMAAILGFSPYKRAIDIWAGKVNPESVEEVSAEHLRWGLLLEPVIRGEYAAKFDIEITAPLAIADYFPRHKIWRDSTLVIGREPWMLAAPDGWMNSVRHGWECKTSSRRTDDWGAGGSDQVPAHYLIQSAWYTEVLEALGWNFGVLFSGNSLEQFRIPRDPQLGNDLYEAGRAFWYDNVLKQVEPPIDESESYGRYLARKFSLNTGAVIENPSEEILDWTAKMKFADDAEKQAAAEKQRANNELRALIGDATKAITPFGSVGWVRPKEREVVDYEAVVVDLLAHGQIDPECLKQHTESRKDNPFLRAWWKK